MIRRSVPEVSGVRAAMPASPSIPASCGDAHQHRFRLIIAGMGGEDGLRPDPACLLCQQRVAGPARCFLQAVSRLGRCLPAQDTAGESEAFRLPGNHLGLGGALPAQPVIDTGDSHAIRGRNACQMRCSMHQDQRIGATGNGDQQAGLAGSEQGPDRRRPLLQGERDRVPGRGGIRRHAQPTRASSRAIESCKAFAASGYCRGICASVAQACSRAPISARAEPRRSNACGARAESA